MPVKESKISFNMIRMYAEKFSYTDEQGLSRVSFNPPAGARDVKRVPFFISFITKEGRLVEGNVICISVDLARRQRKVQFVESGEIRRVRDYLICAIDGVKFITH